MLNGLLIYPCNNDYFNIGDYIQSLAARQFFHNKIDKFINRESLHNYGGGKVKLMLNGWFMHEPQNWPPSDPVFPLFISFHINSLAYSGLLSDTSLVYLRKWQPIGCRDRKTVEILTERGINAYFSACLTLTLGERYSTRVTREGIYFVDVPNKVRRNPLSMIKYLFITLTQYSRIKKLSFKMFQSGSLRSIFRATSFFCTYRRMFDISVLEEAEYIRHNVRSSAFSTESEKFEYAEELVRKYAGAKFIVTSRIHCALPAVGLNTPVIYVDDLALGVESSCRLDGIKELFNVVLYRNGKLVESFNKFVKIGLNEVIPINDAYINYKKIIVKKCNDFVRNIDKQQD